MRFARILHMSYHSCMTDGLTLLLSRWTGGLGRPLIGNYARIPEKLELRGTRLVYSETGRVKRIDAAKLLDRFIGLADPYSSNLDIAAFARDYGPLFLCEHHGLAAYHKPFLMTFSALGPAPLFGIDEPFKYRWCGPKIERLKPQTLFSESVEAWRVLARRATNLLLDANAVRLNGDAPSELWEKVDGFSGSFAKRDGPKWAYLDKPWQRLAANLEYWIVATDVCLRVGVEGEAVVAELGPNPFTVSSFALVAIQLLLAITRAEGLTLCSGCGAPFISKRQPLAGKRVGRWMARRNYCRQCHERSVPQRDAARNYRKREAQKRLH
jgi:hypothetical protein